MFKRRALPKLAIRDKDKQATDNNRTASTPTLKTNVANKKTFNNECENKSESKEFAVNLVKSSNNEPLKNEESNPLRTTSCTDHAEILNSNDKSGSITGVKQNENTRFTYHDTTFIIQEEKRDITESHVNILEENTSNVQEKMELADSLFTPDINLIMKEENGNPKPNGKTFKETSQILNEDQDKQKNVTIDNENLADDLYSSYTLNENEKLKSLRIPCSDDIEILNLTDQSGGTALKRDQNAGNNTYDTELIIKEENDNTEPNEKQDRDTSRTLNNDQDKQKNVALDNDNLADDLYSSYTLNRNEELKSLRSPCTDDIEILNLTNQSGGTALKPDKNVGNNTYDTNFIIKEENGSTVPNEKQVKETSQTLNNDQDKQKTLAIDNDNLADDLYSSSTINGNEELKSLIIPCTDDIELLNLTDQSGETVLKPDENAGNNTYDTDLIIQEENDNTVPNEKQFKETSQTLNNDKDKQKNFTIDNENLADDLYSSNNTLNGKEYIDSNRIALATDVSSLKSGEKRTKLKDQREKQLKEPKRKKCQRNRRNLKGRQHDQVDPNVMSLKDYISYNPFTEPPMKEEDDKMEEEQTITDGDKEVEPEPMIIIKDGEITVNADSVKIKQTKLSYKETVTKSNWQKPIRPGRKWSLIETAQFYYVLWKFGIDFAIIAKVIPTKTRLGLKMKFNYEKKYHGDLLNAAIYEKLENFSSIVKNLMKIDKLDKLQKYRQKRKQAKSIIKSVYKNFCKKSRIKKKRRESPIDTESLTEEEEEEEEEEVRNILIQLKTSLQYSGIHINESYNFDVIEKVEVDCNWTITHNTES